MYGCSVSESCYESSSMLSPTVIKLDEVGNKDNSEGKEKALAAGCNANNSNASARSANCNNAASNDNSYFAGAFAVKKIETSRKYLTSQPTRLNTAHYHTATGEYGLINYEELPFWNVQQTIENSTKSERAIRWEHKVLNELSTANHKKKLRNLKRFITNPIIIKMGVDRCLDRASDSPEVRDLASKKEYIIQKITDELSNETYKCKPLTSRLIIKKGNGEKSRNAHIYTVYDRRVQNILLIVLQEKLTNLIPRWCYSGIKERSLWSNNKTYCLINKIRTYVKRHPNSSAGLTDIKHFYENLNSKIVLGVLFETITCPYTRKLLCNILLQHETLVIGGTLSQLFAMLTLAEMDKLLMQKFHLQFYATFGDNRIMMDDNRRKVVEVLHWENSYLAGRYNLEMKKDWQVVRVSNGFVFCKQHFKSSFVNVRSEIRRRAIRAAGKGQQHYAGYYGMLKKTDSRRLTRLINNPKKLKNMRNSVGMVIKPMQGESIKLNNLIGKNIVITEYTIKPNNKDSEYFVRFQFIILEDDGSKRLCVANNGSYEIKEFFKLVKEGRVKLPIKTKIMSEGISFYFEGYHTSNQEACELLCKKLGIN